MWELDPVNGESASNHGGIEGDAVERRLTVNDSAEHSYPEGSVPSVRPPLPVPTNGRRGGPELYAYGGWPTPSPGNWVAEAGQRVIDRMESDEHSAGH